MLEHARAEDVLKEMLGVLDKLAIPLRLMLSLGMDEPNVNKSIMHKINQVRKEIGYQPLPNSHVTTVFRKIWLSIDIMMRNYASTSTTSSRGVHADEKTSLKLRNHLVLKS